MGLSADRAKSSVRFSLGIYNTHEDVDYLLEKLPGIIQRLRGLDPKANVAPARPAAALP